MKLGMLELPAYAMLAPMAGVSDRALRELCMRYGAVASVGEMVSCKGLVQGSRKSAELMEIGEREMPCAIQLFGDEAEPMARLPSWHSVILRHGWISTWGALPQKLPETAAAAP